MKPLGSVVNFSPKGSIVIRSDITPRIGQIVCDNKGVPLGKIIRITGPVDRPYVLVSPLAKDEMSLFRISGKRVFLDDSPRQLERRDRGGRAGPPPPQGGRRDQKGKSPYRSNRPQGGGGYGKQDGGNRKKGQGSRSQYKDKRNKGRK